MRWRLIAGLWVYLLSHDDVWRFLEFGFESLILISQLLQLEPFGQTLRAFGILTAPSARQAIDLQPEAHLLLGLALFAGGLWPGDHPDIRPLVIAANVYVADILDQASWS